MAEYLTPIDIANRALDHCGVPHITAFTNDSKAADSTSSVYDKLRVAELRRNVWVFAVRKTALRVIDVDTMFLVPAAWSSTAVYPQGSIVSYNDVIWFAGQYVPANTTPGAPNEAYWAVYFGPMTVTPWDSDSALSYYAGELVYFVDSNVISVYQCLTSDTDADPTELPDAWDADTTYNIGDTVVDGSSVEWQSRTDLNTGNAAVAGTYWQAVPVANQAATQVGQDWLKINATVSFRRFLYPIGAGPGSQTTSRNVYRLPSGYLRKAPQNPKAGAVSYLGAPGGIASDDWEFEGNYITTSDNPVIVLRFVADIRDVTKMDPMFCEGLGARIGLEICEPLTQSGDKLRNIGQIYKTFMGEARAINGIEAGPTELPLDDWLACRL